jgi:hypothetical protein
MAFNPTITNPSKEHNEYPEVTFWLHDEYKKRKRIGGSRYRFLQDADGEEITEGWLNKIRAFLLGALNELQELLADNNALPQTWANATKGHAMINACHTKLHRRFDEFTLCNGDWKAHSFMIEWYPNWARNHLDPQADMEDDIEITSTVPAKRAAASESLKKSIKKIKVKEEPQVKILEIHDPLYTVETLLYALTLATTGHLWTLIQQLTIKSLPLAMQHLPPFPTTKHALPLSICPALALLSFMSHQQHQIPYRQYLLCLVVAQ